MIRIGSKETAACHLFDRLHERIAEALCDAPADDDHLRIEHVDDVAGQQAEVVLGAGDHFLHHLVVRLEGVGDHAAGHPIPAVLLDEPRDDAGIARGAHVAFHGRPAGQRLDAAESPAAALGTILFNDHVPDLAGRTAEAAIDLAIDDQSPANARADPDTHSALRSLRCTEGMLADDGDLDVVSQNDHYAALLPHQLSTYLSLQ